ncbi:MAG: M48 family metallopeptidase [Anaerolineae bacterium]|nr:M48 family metallopeptidase [Anaerolineae bacterium]
MWIFIALLLIQFAISTLLSELNLVHLKRVAAAPPPEWAARLDTSRFPQMIAYSAANTRLGRVSRAVGLGVTLAILLSGFLSTLAGWASALAVPRVVQGLAIFAVLGAISYLSDIPFDLISSFGVEKRFGFSTITLKTWLLDQAKSLALTLVLGVLLGGGLLLLIEWLGDWWWLAAWLLFGAFQILVGFLAPVVILPLFNTFEPLKDEELREKIEALAQKAHFPLGGVFQIDASLRSTHSNAYFTGFGKTRRIALFDTLLDQHTHEEILSILAHEIGHWKKKHVFKQLAAGLVLSGIGFLSVKLLLDIPWLYETLDIGDLYRQVGTAGAVAAVGLYLVSILLSPLGLFVAPLANWVSRRYEYQADAYSLDLYDHPTALETGLIALSEKNLSNLFPHPLVVAFRYSHPPLIERVAAIRAIVMHTRHRRA